MDNLSHSVAGLAAGELIHRCLPEETDPVLQRIRHRLLLMACWAASNFPDLDLVLAPLIPDPIGYLLHHRGHTHTLLYAIPQALLLFGFFWLFWPSARSLLRASRNTRIGFALAVGVGLVLHLMMDYLNSYGIHPFHPFDSRWYYGDMMFILEPVFWIAFGVPMAMAIRSIWIKSMLLAVLGSVILYFTINQYLSWFSFAALAVIALVLACSSFRAGAHRVATLLLALGISVQFVLLQWYASEQAKRAITALTLEIDPSSRVLDAVTSPFPTNPVCWSYVSVAINEGAGSYRLRRGILSIAPHTMPVAECPASLSERSLQQNVTPAVTLLSEEVGSLQTLRTLKQQNCHFDAWLRFARAPSVSATQAMDIRFSSNPRGNFTTLRFEDFKNRACSTHVPLWDYPRSDLLDTPQRQPEVK